MSISWGGVMKRVLSSSATARSSIASMACLPVISAISPTERPSNSRNRSSPTSETTRSTMRVTVAPTARRSCLYSAFTASRSAGSDMARMRSSGPPRVMARQLAKESKRFHSSSVNS